MGPRHYRFFFLLIFILLLSIGYMKGCNSTEYPKQLPLPDSIKNKISKNFTIPRDSTICIAAGKHYDRGPVNEILLGTHYRDLWGVTVKMPVFDIRTVKGGFRIIKQGGNMQTLNLRLESKEGKRYVLRTVDKDPSKILPAILRNKIFVYIIRDLTTALNPYGAFAVSGLAEAAGILHTHPELYFVPYDPNFGQYANLMEGRVAILEEFPDESWADTETFGKAHKIESSSDMLGKRLRSPQTRIDQKAFARARLFDIWINDWDRHTGQWKWAFYKEDSVEMLQPIPRDRDIAFYNFNSGLIPKLVLLVNPKFQTFTYGYENIAGLTKNGRFYIDRLVFNSISEAELLEVARDLKSRLTDEAIETAIKQWPPEVFRLEGPETISKLKVRRNLLENVARDYYRLLYKQVMIVGTDESEKFVVDRMDNKHTSVTIYDKNGKQYYSYIFDHAFTQELQLYGLNGEDQFIVKGKTDEGITVKIYGGQDSDEIHDHSFVKGGDRKTKVYDLKNNNLIDGGEETEDRSTQNPHIMDFDRVGLRKQK